ncbi:MAG: DUF1501 domain-containing protein, partial [Planctomycetes bacterium]|nr:DUF1501 domain-containing protein [Planctomycetota bacterium]
PFRDDDYRRLRPTLALPAPDPAAPAGRTTLRLDDDFSLHPALAPLLPHFREGRLAVVHAVGTGDRTRSHFEAQDLLEHGAAEGQVLSGGWLGRHLRARGGKAAAMQALAFGETIPESLRGAPSAGAVRSLEDVRLATRTGDEAGVVRALAALHGEGEDLLRRSGRETLALLRRVQEIRSDGAGDGADWPADDFGRALSQVGRLLRARVGLEAACVDLGGFDTHFGQGGLEPGLAGGAGIGALAADLGGMLEETTILVVTEFGRRAYENSALGTDHGSGSVCLLLGGGVRGGKVHGRWPGLARDRLFEESDLAVTTDLRQVLAEVLVRRCGCADPAAVFPGLAYAPVGVCG